jgi:putative MATE family efflux protein
MLRFKSTKDVDMLSGSIVKGLLAIAIPIMIMNVMQSLFNIIDMRILKMYDTELTVGAVGACGYIISLMTGLVVGLSSGANVVIARFIGQGDKDKVERSVGTALLLAVSGGVILSIVGVSLAEVILTWMNCPQNLLPYSTLYFRLYFAGIPIQMVYNSAAAILRSTGDSKRPMIFLTVAGVFKVLFNYLFVAKLDMTVDGVAYATIISWSISCALGLLAIIKTKSIAKVNFKKLRFYKSEVKEILAIGVPAGMQQALYSIANVIISSTVNTYGEYATTGISIANTFDGILYQIVTATALAVMPYVSQNVGHGNIKRAKQAVVRGILITSALGVFFGSLSALLSGQLSSIMADNPEIIKYSQQKMIIISSTYFICGINDIIGCSLRGMRRPLVSMITTMVYMCALRFVWVFLIFNPLRDSLSDPLTFLYLVWPVGWTLSIATLLCFYFPTARKLERDAQAPKEEALQEAN